eukprot:GHVH01011111.1.p1 GENE.GHVH01011111.1~~GHVH01011111.1.p1  ORF type:complete len:1109 (+),score=161.32 GHVH01011111.1:238-3564(+)
MQSDSTHYSEPIQNNDESKNSSSPSVAAAARRLTTSVEQPVVTTLGGDIEEPHQRSESGDVGCRVDDSIKVQEPPGSPDSKKLILARHEERGSGDLMGDKLLTTKSVLTITEEKRLIFKMPEPESGEEGRGIDDETSLLNVTDSAIPWVKDPLLLIFPLNLTLFDTYEDYVTMYHSSSVFGSELSIESPGSTLKADYFPMPPPSFWNVIHEELKLQKQKSIGEMKKNLKVLLGLRKLRVESTSSAVRPSAVEKLPVESVFPLANSLVFPSLMYPSNSALGDVHPPPTILGAPKAPRLNLTTGGGSCKRPTSILLPNGPSIKRSRLPAQESQPPPAEGPSMSLKLDGRPHRRSTHPLDPPSSSSRTASSLARYDNESLTDRLPSQPTGRSSSHPYSETTLSSSAAKTSRLSSRQVNNTANPEPADRKRGEGKESDRGRVPRAPADQLSPALASRKNPFTSSPSVHRVDINSSPASPMTSSHSTHHPPPPINHRRLQTPTAEGLRGVATDSTTSAHSLQKVQSRAEGATKQTAATERRERADDVKEPLPGRKIDIISSLPTSGASLKANDERDADRRKGREGEAFSSSSSSKNSLPRSTFSTSFKCITTGAPKKPGKIVNMASPASTLDRMKSHQDNTQSVPVTVPASAVVSNISSSMKHQKSVERSDIQAISTSSAVPAASSPPLSPVSWKSNNKPLHSRSVVISPMKNAIGRHLKMSLDNSALASPRSSSGGMETGSSAEMCQPRGASNGFVAMGDEKSQRATEESRTVAGRRVAPKDHSKESLQSTGRTSQPPHKAQVNSEPVSGNQPKLKRADSSVPLGCSNTKFKARPTGLYRPKESISMDVLPQGRIPPVPVISEFPVSPVRSVQQCRTADSSPSSAVHQIVHRRSDHQTQANFTRAVVGSTATTPDRSLAHRSTSASQIKVISRTGANQNRRLEPNTKAASQESLTSLTALNRKESRNLEEEPNDKQREDRSSQWLYRGAPSGGGISGRSCSPRVSQTKPIERKKGVSAATAPATPATAAATAPTVNSAASTRMSNTASNRSTAVEATTTLRTTTLRRGRITEAPSQPVSDISSLPREGDGRESRLFRGLFSKNRQPQGKGRR